MQIYSLLPSKRRCFVFERGNKLCFIALSECSPIRKANKTYYIIVIQSSFLMKHTYLCTNKGTLIQHSEEDKSLEINFSQYLRLNCQVGLVYANSLNSAVVLICIEVNSFCLEDAKPQRLRPLDLTASRSQAHHKASREPAQDLLMNLPDGQHGQVK